jgi:hypothetical protein
MCVVLPRGALLAAFSPDEAHAPHAGEPYYQPYFLIQ